jgi:putative PIN family toxin of toxin-antitoxin system
VFLLALDGSIQLCVSGQVYAEYEEVISRPRFQRSEGIIAGTLDAIRQKGFWVIPSARVQLCSDPDDDIFLECAQAAQADYLVTGNVKHFLASWQGTQVITARRLRFWPLMNVNQRE